MFEEILSNGTDPIHVTEVGSIIGLAVCVVCIVTGCVGVGVFWCFKKCLGDGDGDKGLFEKDRSPKKKRVWRGRDEDYELERDIKSYQIMPIPKQGGPCLYLSDCCSGLSNCCSGLKNKFFGFFQRDKSVISEKNLKEAIILRNNEEGSRWSIQVT